MRRDEGQGIGPQRHADRGELRRRRPTHAGEPLRLRTVGRLSGARKRKWGRHCCRPHCHRRVGPEGHLAPDVLRTARGPPRTVARRSRRCRFRRGSEMVRRPLPLPPGGSATGQSAWRFRPGNAGHCRSICAGRKARPADCAPSVLQRSGSCGIRRCPGFHSSTPRHFAVASKAVPKSPRFSGFDPVNPKSQSLLSMTEECASAPSRASEGRGTYPLSPRMPVDSGG